jgi:Domain of unknown function (DUF397)
MSDLSHPLATAQWRKASRSGQNNGACVEVAFGLPGITAIRDSTRPQRGTHVVSREAFADLLRDVKAGALDI